MVKEVTSNGKTFGEGTQITFTIKTVVWIIGLLSLAFGGFYTDMKKRIKNVNTSMETQVTEEMIQYKEDVTEVKSDVKSVQATVNQNAINIGILLDRSSGDRSAGTSTITAEENVPTSIIHGGTP